MALLSPVQDRGERLELAQVDRVTPAFRPRQEQERFLNVGSQHEQVQDLGYAGARHVGSTSGVAGSSPPGVAEIGQKVNAGSNNALILLNDGAWSGR